MLSAISWTSTAKVSSKSSSFSAINDFTASGTSFVPFMLSMNPWKMVTETLPRAIATDNGVMNEIEMSDKDARREILRIVSAEPGLGYVEISERLRVDIDQVLMLCHELVEENKLTTDC